MTSATMTSSSLIRLEGPVADSVCVLKSSTSARFPHVCKMAVGATFHSRLPPDASRMAGPPPQRKTFDRSIIEGPIRPAVWRLAWPTMLQNIIAGLQGIIDHAMVGHFVG